MPARAESFAVALLGQEPAAKAGQTMVPQGRFDQLFVQEEETFAVALPGGTTVTTKSTWTTIRSGCGVVSGITLSLPTDGSYEGAVRALTGLLARYPALKTEQSEAVAGWATVAPAGRKDVNVQYLLKQGVRVSLGLEGTLNKACHASVGFDVVRDDLRPVTMQAAKAWTVPPDRTLELPGPTRELAIALSPDGRTLAISKYGYLMLADMATLAIHTQFETLGAGRTIGGATSLAFTPDARQLVMFGRGLDVVDLETGALVSHVDGTREDGSRVQVLPDGSGFLRDTKEGIEVCGIDGKALRQIDGYGERLHGLFQCVSADATRMVVQYARGQYGICDLATGKKLVELESAGDISRYAFSADNQRVIGCEFMNHAGLVLWDAASGKKLTTIACDSRASVYLTPDAKLAVSPTIGAMYYDYLGLYDTATGKQLAELGDFGNSPAQALITPDGSTLVVTVRDENRVFVWDLRKY